MNRKKIYGLICLAVILISSVGWSVFSGQGEEKTSAKSISVKAENKPVTAVETLPAVENPVVPTNPTVEPQIPQSDKFVTADQNFSNLQVPEFNKPVYDNYGYWQRQESGMATTLPELQPYYGEHIVYLTFDDGPDDKNTPAILDILRAENVPATFYVLGAMVEAYPDVLKRIFNEGHAIGNHSYNHNYKELYSSPWNFIEQFQHTDDIIMEQIGVRPLIIRAPGGTYGAFNQDYWDMVKSSGYVAHDWNVSSGDATPKGAMAYEEITNITEQINTYNFKSAIVLMHSTAAKDETVKALPDIIHFFKDRGYTFGVITPMTPQPW